MPERNEPLDMRLYEEDVQVVRHQVNRDYETSEIPSNAFQEIEFEIPIRGEEIEIRTRPVVCEEVVVSKVVRERSRLVPETPHRDDRDVDGDYIDDEMLDVMLGRNRSGRAR